MSEKLLVEYKPEDSVERKEEFLLEHLKNLSKIDSLSTHEENTRGYLEDELAKLGIETQTDKKGNLWVISDAPEGEIFLSAHMDKVGKGADLKMNDKEIIGCLDDAVGLSVILEMYKRGLKPSSVFTVEEECEIEEDGKIRQRDLPDGIYNAGARQAVDEIFDLESKPKIVIVLDVSEQGPVGNGPLVYQTGGAPRKNIKGEKFLTVFRYPKGPLKDIVKIFRDKEIQATFKDGFANDAIEFTFIPGVGVCALEVPIENMHSNREKANLNDIEQAVIALETLIKNHDKIDRYKEVLTHTQKGKKIESE